MNTSTKGQSITTSKPSRLATRKFRHKLVAVSPYALAVVLDVLATAMWPEPSLFIHRILGIGLLMVGGAGLAVIAGLVPVVLLIVLFEKLKDWADEGTE